MDVGTGLSESSTKSTQGRRERAEREASLLPSVLLSVSVRAGCAHLFVIACLCAPAVRMVCGAVVAAASQCCVRQPRSPSSSSGACRCTSRSERRRTVLRASTARRFRVLDTTVPLDRAPLQEGDRRANDGQADTDQSDERLQSHITHRCHGRAQLRVSVCCGPCAVVPIRLSAGLTAR